MRATAYVGTSVMSQKLTHAAEEAHPSSGDGPRGTTAETYFPHSSDRPVRDDRAPVGSRPGGTFKHQWTQPREGGHVLQFIREEEGQGLVEYALIIAVIAIAVIVAMVFLRGQIENIFSNIGNNLT